MSPNRINKRHKYRGQRKGTYVVEMAVTLPVVFLITLGGLEIMQFCRVRHAVNQAAYEAARVMIVPGGDANEAGLVANRIASANLLRLQSITYDPKVITDDTRQVTVIVQASFKNSWGISKLFADDLVESRCTLAHENTAITKFD